MSATTEERLNTLTKRLNELDRAVRRTNTGKVVSRSPIPQAVPPRPGATIHRTPTDARAAQSATLVIASSESSDMGKELANYVCTGSADQDTIQEALWSLRPNGSGTNPQNPGRVVFLEGRYFQTGPWTPVTEVTLEGMGRTFTQFYSSSGTGFFIDATSLGTDGEPPIRVSDLGFRGLGGRSGITWNVPGNGITIDNCMFDSTPQAIVSQYAGGTYIDYYLTLIDNLFQGAGGGGRTIELLRRQFMFTMINNIFDDPFGPSYDLWMESGDGDDTNFAVISGNAFYHSVHIEDMFSLQMGDNSSNFNLEIEDTLYSVLADNVFTGAATLTNTRFVGIDGGMYQNGVTVDQPEMALLDGVMVEGGSIDLTNIAYDHRGSIVSSCIVEGGRITVTGGRGVLVDGNRISGNVDNCIVIDDSPDCVVTDSLIISCNIGNHAGAMIVVTGDSHRAHVHGNTGRRNGSQSDSGGSCQGQVDYFVKIDTGVTRAKVWGNDGYDLWTTAAVQDLGTSTDLTSANR